MRTKVYKTNELATMVSGELHGDGQLVIQSLNSISLAGEDQITFADDKKHFPALYDCKASAVLVPQKIDDLDMTQIVIKDVNEALITILGAFEPEREIKTGVHSSAVVSETAKIGDNAYIGPFVFIDDNVVIGDNTIIEANSVVKYNSTVGSHCHIDPNVTIHHKCHIGNHCLIQSNSTIGSIGFGYRPVNNMPQLIPHYGGVVIEDFVEIGANCCVDRAKFGDTVIGLGTKLDNLIQIAHNCKIGKCCLIAAGSGVGGSTELGDGIVMGGHSGVIDNIKLVAGTQIASKAVAYSNTTKPIALYGCPAREITKAMKSAAETNRLPKTVKRIKKLEKKVANLEKANNN